MPEPAGLPRGMTAPSTAPSSGAMRNARSRGPPVVYCWLLSDTSTVYSPGDVRAGCWHRTACPLASDAPSAVSTVPLLPTGVKRHLRVPLSPPVRTCLATSSALDATTLTLTWPPPSELVWLGITSPASGWS